MAVENLDRKPNEEEIKRLNEKGYEYVPDSGEFGGVQRVAKEEVAKEEVAKEEVAKPKQSPEAPRRIKVDREPTFVEKVTMVNKGLVWDDTDKSVVVVPGTRVDRPPAKAEKTKLASKGFSFNPDSQEVHDIGVGRVPIEKDVRLNTESAQKLIWLAGREKWRDIEPSTVEKFETSVVGLGRSMLPNIEAGIKGSLGLPAPVASAQAKAAQESAFEPLKRRRFQDFSILDADPDYWKLQGERLGNPWSDVDVSSESLLAAAKKYRESHERKFRDAQKNLSEYEGMTRVGKTFAGLVGEGSLMGQPEAVAESTGATQLLKEANADLQMARYLESAAKSNSPLPQQSDFEIERFRGNLRKGIDLESEMAAHRMASEAQDHTRGLVGDPADMEWEQITDTLFSADTANNAVGAVIDGLTFIPIVFKNVLVDPIQSGVKWGYANVTGEEQEEIDRLQQEWEDESFEIFQGGAFAAQGIGHIVGKGAGGLETLATGTPEEKEKTLKRITYGAHKYAADVMTAVGGAAGLARARVASRVAKLSKEIAKKTELLDELIKSAPEDAPAWAGRPVSPTAEGVTAGLSMDNVPFGTFNRATREAQTPSGSVVIPNMERLPIQSQAQVQALVDEIAALGLRRKLVREAHNKLEAFEAVADPTYAILRAYGAIPGLLSKVTEFDGGNLMRTLFRQRSDVLDDIRVDNVMSTEFRDIDGNGYSVSDMLYERRPDLAKRLIEIRDTAERVPDELLSQVEDMVTEFAKTEGKELWFETPSGDLKKVHTAVPEFDPQGVFGRPLSQQEKADMRARPEETAKLVSERLNRKRSDVVESISENNYATLGLTAEEAATARGLVEEADRTANLVKDTMLLQKQTNNIKSRVVANVRRREKAVKANDNNKRQLGSEFGKARTPPEQKQLLAEAMAIVDEADAKWGTGKDKYNAESQQARLKQSQEDLKHIANKKSDDGKFILSVAQRARVKKSAKVIGKIAKAENEIVGTVRTAYGKVPYQAIDSFDAMVAKGLESHIISIAKQDASMAEMLLNAVDDALNASRRHDAAQEAFDTGAISKAADADKNVARLMDAKKEAKAAYDEAMAKIDAGLDEARTRADGLLNDRINNVEQIAASTTIEEAFKAGGNGSVAKQSALLQAGYVPRAIPAKHIALARAVKLNQDPSLPAGKMNPFAEELDQKLAASGEDFTVTNNGNGWSEADMAYFDWVNDTFNVSTIPSARVAYIDTPPGGFANEQVLLIAADGIRASDPKIALASKGGVFKGDEARIVAKFRTLQDEGKPIPESLQAQVDALDFGRAYKRELSEVVRLREKGESVPPELQRVYDNVVASLAGDMRQKITETTVRGIESGYFSDEMAEAVLTRIADYFPDTYLKTEQVYSSLGERAAAIVAKVRGKSSQSLNDYSQRGNHKKRAVNKHLTRAERKEKGLVSDARVAFIRGYNEILNDIANLNFFDKIRDAKVTTGPFKGQKLMMTAEEVDAAGLPKVEIDFGKKPPVIPELAEAFKELRVVLANKGGAKYVRLPKDARLGEFSNKYVPDDVFFEFKRLVETPAETLLSYNSALQWFKWGKTAASAATSGRNHIANWTVADLNNMVVGSGSETARKVLNKDLMSQAWNQKGPLYEEAMISGVLGSDFVTSELSQTFKFSDADIPDFFSITDNPTLLSTTITAWEMGRYNEVASIMGEAVAGAPKSAAKAILNAPESAKKGVKGFVRFTTHQYRFGDELYKTWRYTQIRTLQDEFSKTGTLTREMESALGGKAEALEVLNIDGKYAKMRAAAKKTHRDGFVDYSGSSLAIGWLSKGPQPFARFTGAITPVIKRLLARNAVKSLLYRNTTRQLEEYTMRIDSEKNGYDYEDIEIARSTLGFGNNVNGFFVGQREYTDAGGRKHKYFGFQNLGPLGAYAGSALPSSAMANEPTSQMPLAGMFRMQFPILAELGSFSYNRTKYDSNYGDLAGYDVNASYSKNALFAAMYYGQDLMPVIARDLYRAGALLVDGKFVTPSGRVLFPEDIVDEVLLLQKPGQANRKSFKLAEERAKRKSNAFTFMDWSEAKGEQFAEGGSGKAGVKAKYKKNKKKAARAIRDEFRAIKKKAREQAARTKRSAQRKRIGDARETARDRQRGLEESIKRINREAAQ